MDDLIAALGDIPVITDTNSVRRRSRDFYWYSPVLKPQLDGCFGDIVVMPRSEAEVIKTLKLCQARDVPVTVRGGGTGNYGQAVPLRGGVILETRNLEAIEWMRPGRVRTAPGIRIEVLEKACREGVGGELRMFPSTIRHATIGGYIAGGSSGIGSVTWGLLRDWGNLVAARVVTMEAEPRVIELRGHDVQKVNHAYGTNGVITALELPLAPAVDWVDLLVAMPDFGAAMHFARNVSEQPGIQKRLVSLVAGPTPARHFEALARGLDERDHAVLLIVAREDVETVEALVGGAQDARVSYRSDQDASPDIDPIYEYAWNHTTLRALKHDRSVTYLQVLFAGPDRWRLIEESFVRFGDEVPMHLEYINFGDHIGCFGLQLVRYTSEARLREIMDYFDGKGCPVFDPHAYTLEGGGMKQIDPLQLAFKREADPKGLLNPGKMIGWDNPDYDGTRVPVRYMYEAG
ncbi:MAG: FAD-binding oxidoreductase [Bauldia sp.]|nr:FAD-binding oxidoreductase [Bauldia sp.]